MFPLSAENSLKYNVFLLMANHWGSSPRHVPIAAIFWWKEDDVGKTNHHPSGVEFF